MQPACLFGYRVSRNVKFKDSNNNLLWPKLIINFNQRNIKFIIQINGKTRNVLEIKSGQNEEMIMKMLNKIKNHLNKKIIKKTIFIKIN